jgi:hypothetical protein
MKNKTCRNVMDNIDLYGGTPNQFTIKGRTNLHSYCGVGCSILHLTAIFIFACIKLSFVATKHNPGVSVFTEAE